MTPTMISLSELLGHWQSITMDDGNVSPEDRRQKLNYLYSSIGAYAEIVPAGVRVPAPGDMDGAVQ